MSKTKEHRIFFVAAMSSARSPTIRLKSNGDVTDIPVPKARPEDQSLKPLAEHVLKTVGKHPTLKEVLESVPRMKRESKSAGPSNFVLLRRDSPWIAALEKGTDYSDDAFDREHNAYVSDSWIVDASMSDIFDEMRCKHLLPTPTKVHKFPIDRKEIAEKMHAALKKRYPSHIIKAYYDDVEEEHVIECFG